MLRGALMAARAPNGATEKSIRLQLSLKLYEACATDARNREVTLSEWIREAMRRRLGDS